MNFDLTIENYTTNELIEMFDLPLNYDKNILETKEIKLKNSIINNKEITNETQEKTINFLVKAKNILLNKVVNFNNDKGYLYENQFNIQSTKIEDPEEHMVQIRDKTPYGLSYNSNYVSGVINPLKKITIKKNLCIDSRFRENYYTTLSTDFFITLPLLVNNVLTMTLQNKQLCTLIGKYTRD